MKKISIVSALPFAMLVAACGGSDASMDSKDGAADTAYRVQQTGEELHGRRSQALTAAQFDDELPGGDGIPGGDPLNQEWTETFSGQSGSATVTNKASVSGTDVQTEYTVEYSGYSSDGLTFLTGAVTHSTKVSADSTTAEVINGLSGTVELSGDRVGIIDLAVEMIVSAGSGGASVVMTGNIVVDGSTFEYSDEAIEVSSGAF